MNWDAIGGVAELVAAAGVIVTLFYLAVQIRENSSWMKRQAFGSGVEAYTTWCARVRDNPDVLGIYLQGSKDFESFDQTDRARYHLTKIEIMATIETTLEHAKTDGIKKGATNAAERLLTQEMKGAGAKYWWQHMGRQYFSDDFGQMVDALMSDRGDELATPD